MCVSLTLGYGVIVTKESLRRLIKYIHFWRCIIPVSLNCTTPTHPLPCPTLQALFTLKENCLFCSQSSAEQKDLSDSGEEPRGEAEAPHHGTGHPESAGEHALELPVPASALARAPEAQLLPFPRELAGVSPPPPGIPQVTSSWRQLKR